MRKVLLMIVVLTGLILTGCGQTNNKQEEIIASNQKIKEPVLVQETINPAPTNAYTPEKVEPVPTVADDWFYSSANLKITIEEKELNGTHYFVADVQFLKNADIESATADEIYHGDLRETTSHLAEELGAVFAINADYYVARTEGVIVRKREALRDKPDMDDAAMCFDMSGDMTIVNENSTSPKDLISSGVVDSYSFGPSLLDSNGNALTSFTNSNVTKANPRTGVGQIEPGHLIFIVADGRQPDYSVGFTMEEFAKVFEDLGCTIAYNLDGGGSSTMYFNGRVVNKPANGDERPVYDAICIIDENYAPEQ